MALNHSEAIARVTVDGLGICCFNRREKKWDLVFLRLPPPACHELILRVEGHPQPVHVNPGEGPISFETVNGRFPSGFPHGFFDNGLIPDRKIEPTATDEIENFRWVLDLETDVPHGFIGLKKPRPPIGLTRAFIHDAVFYTQGVSSRDLILVHDSVTANPASDPPFGRTNNEISADIFCDPGGQVIIKLGEDELFPPLDHRPGNPWKICLTNLCRALPPPVGFGKGDFQLFYEVLEISGDKHALWGERVNQQVQCHADPDKGVGGEPITAGRPDCDTTRLGTIESFDELFS